MTRPPDDKPETLRVVCTQGGYAVFVSPSAQPAAVFTSGFDVLDWLAHRIAEWETRQPAARRPGATAEGGAVEEADGEGELGAGG